MGSIFKSISAELLKLKSTYVLWLALLVVSFISFVVFIGHYLDVNSMARIGENPWDRIGNAGHAILSIFMLNLFSVLIISASAFVENKSSGWKLLYTYPRYRSTIFYSKLLVILIVVLLTICAVAFGLIITGYGLDLLRPEYEFRYYPIGLLEFTNGLIHSFLALLGVIGIQYFLSLQFKNFLIPTGIGVIGFIMGLILGTLNTPKSLYCPYSYPLIVKDFNMFTIDKVGVVQYGWLNNVEIYSLICFVVFVVIAHILEIKKNIV